MVLACFAITVGGLSTKHNIQQENAASHVGDASRTFKHNIPRDMDGQSFPVACLNEDQQSNLNHKLGHTAAHTVGIGVLAR